MGLATLLIPESQRDPHYWSSVFGAHCWIALGPWGVISIGWTQWIGAWVTPLLYLIVWEGLQFYLAKRRTWALFWDAILDTVAVAFGCYAAACLGNDLKLAAVACWGASMIVLAVGWIRRENRIPKDRIVTYETN